MGRGKKWSSEERERVAIAWTRATHDPVVGRNQSGETFDEKVYSLFSRKPLKDADPGTYSERSHPSIMTCFHNNISPDVMKFIGVLQMVKGVGLSGVNAEQLICISVAVYLLKRKGETLPKSNSAFYLLKEADPDNWENFKAWNILKSTPKFLEPQGDTSETTEEEEDKEDGASPPNEVNVEDQPSTTDASADDPPEETQDHDNSTNVSSTSSYKPSDDSSTSASLVNVISHSSRPKKQHLGRDAAKAKPQLDKERQNQTKLLSEMHDTMKDSKKRSAESLTTMQLKTYYKMCKHRGNDEGCDAAMEAMHDLLNQSGVLPVVVVQAIATDDVEQEEV